MDIKEFLRHEVKPAYGCTDPGAVALAAAAAAARLEEEPRSVHLALSANIFKNGLHVGIPGAQGLTGNLLAAALGVLRGDPDRGLEVLDSITPQDVDRARVMVEAGAITQELVEDVPNVYARAEVTAPGGSAAAVVSGRPDRVVEVRSGGEVVWRCEVPGRNGELTPAGYQEELRELEMGALWGLVQDMDEKTEDFMLHGAAMNQAVAEQGLARPWGLGFGHWLATVGSGKDLLWEIKAHSAAAADVRMAGGPFPVMSSGGSGNHGITAVVPLSRLAASRGATRRELAEALLLSHLVTGYVKAYTGLLTPVCGCGVAAGLGAAAGMVRLLGGGPEAAERAAAVVLSSVLGMVCDGAKGSCALKVSTAAGEAYLAAVLSVDGLREWPRQGVVSGSLKQMGRVIGLLNRSNAAQMEATLLQILQQPELD